MNNARAHEASTPQNLFNGVLGGPIWCLFAFPTKVPNICNSRMNASPKMGVHLGVIGLHPLHSPPFVKVCFTPKHIFYHMGPCTSHLVVNPMLGLQHMCPLEIVTIPNYKCIGPPISMCWSIHYPFTMKRHAPIRNWDNIR
jgi:hypothetical protein